MPMQLQDHHGRKFHYLRLSITDVCNFRCIYCLPDGYQKAEAPAFLTVPEIKRLLTAFVGLGLWKVRLTGGEPSLRKDFLEIAHTTATIPGIRRVALSTNGYRLTEFAQAYKDVGISAINISLDSLDRATFKKITGQDRLAEVLQGIERALAVGFAKVKVNAVLMQGLNHQDLNLFLDWIKQTPVSVRFIELMPTDHNPQVFYRHHLRAGTLIEKLREAGWLAVARTLGDGPAKEFMHPDYQGKIGFITPYAKQFCESCNRLRITSQGALRLCLFGDENFSLRHLLQADSQLEELQATIIRLVEGKQISHSLQQGLHGNLSNFSAIGG